MAYSLGVDLGTSAVAAAVAHGARVEMVSLGDRTVVAPAVVYVRDDGTIVTGEAAERRALGNPGRVARDLRRRLGDPTPVMLGGAPHAVTTLLAALLSDTVSRITASEGVPPDHVVLTHPSTWGPFRRDLFAQVAALAGVGHARLVTAAEAVAAHHTVTHRLRVDSAVAVYDLGGDTFEATVLRRSASRIDIVGAPEGIEGLGGTDVDAAVLAHLDQASGGALSTLDLDDPRTAAALTRLRQDAVAATEALAVDVETTVAVLLPDRNVDVRLTRGELEDVIRPSVAATIDALTRALRSAGVEPDELDAVLLVGGASRIPLVGQMVTEALGRPVVVDADPAYAVALGAATLAGGTPASAASTSSAPVPSPAATSTAAVATYGSWPAADGSAPMSLGARPADAEPVGDDVAFTLYRPARVAPLEWCPVLVYTHRAAPFLDEWSGHVVDPQRQVENDAVRELPPDRDYGHVSTDGERPVPRGTELILQPWLSEGFVDPPHHTFRWQGSMHRATFRVCAPASPSSPRLVGGVRIYQGPLLVAEARFTIPVMTTTSAPAPLTTDRVTRYRRIFASYSRRDLAVVEAVKDYNLMGDEYLIDLLALRPGEKWEPRLIELIEQTDVFQLFWSRNAMASSHVRREWEHALSLRRPRFVCPVYWEDPRPTDPIRALPPPTLEELHWSRLPASRLPRPDHAAHTAASATEDRPSAPPFRREAVQHTGPTAPSPRTRTPDHRPAAIPAGAAPRSATPADDGTSPVRSTPPRRHRGLLSAALVGVLVLLVVPIGFLLRPTAGPSASAPVGAAPAPGTGAGGGAPVGGAGPAGGGVGAAASVSVPAIAGEIPVGRAPGFVAVAPDGRFAYVADRTAGVVTVIDTAVDRPTATIAFPHGPPQYLAVSPDGARLYVSVVNADRSAGEVVVVDALSLTVQAGVTVGTGPSALAVSPDGTQVYVADRDAGTVSVIDARSRRVIGNIAVPPEPTGVAFSRDGTRAFVACLGSPSITVIDTGRRVVGTGIPVGRSSDALAVRPTTPLLAAVHHDDDEVSVVDTATGRVVATVAVGSHPDAVAWARDGRHLYVVDGDADSLTVIDAGGYRVTATLRTGRSPGSIAVLPDGTKAYVTDVAAGTVTVVDLTS